MENEWSLAAAQVVSFGRIATSGQLRAVSQSANFACSAFCLYSVEAFRAVFPIYEKAACALPRPSLAGRARSDDVSRRFGRDWVLARHINKGFLV
jgi:hypothetical protein